MSLIIILTAAATATATATALLLPPLPVLPSTTTRASYYSIQRKGMFGSIWSVTEN